MATTHAQRKAELIKACSEDRSAVQRNLKMLMKRKIQPVEGFSKGDDVALHIQALHETQEKINRIAEANEIETPAVIVKKVKPAAAKKTAKVKAISTPKKR